MINHITEVGVGKELENRDSCTELRGYVPKGK